MVSFDFGSFQWCDDVYFKLFLRGLYSPCISSPVDFKRSPRLFGVGTTPVA